MAALLTPLLGHQLAEACDPGVCFRDAVSDDVAQRPLEAPVFIRYDATPGSAPTTAEFVASGGSDVPAIIEIFPSGEATEVKHYVAMVLPSTPLAAGTTYNMRITSGSGRLQRIWRVFVHGGRHLACRRTRPHPSRGRHHQLTAAARWEQ
ncbi:MAG: hypothetical protein IPL79_05840 [Myxococcales bacterium]|nr:hypothetical protein [Myxococcales bacterium]